MARRDGDGVCDEYRGSGVPCTGKGGKGDCFIGMLVLSEAALGLEFDGEGRAIYWYFCHHSTLHSERKESGVLGRWHTLSPVVAVVCASTCRAVATSKATREDFIMIWKCKDNI